MKSMGRPSLRSGDGRAAFVFDFALAAYWGDGRTIGKWLLRIRVVSLVYGASLETIVVLDRKQPGR